MANVDERRRREQRDAVGRACETFGLSAGVFPTEAVVALAMTYNQAIEAERVTGTATGHIELLGMDQGLARVVGASKEVGRGGG